MKPIYNQEIRTLIREAGLFGYQVAAAIGISETSFSRAMARGELSQARKAMIVEVCKNAKTTTAE